MDRSLQDISSSFKHFWISIFLISSLTIYVQAPPPLTPVSSTTYISIDPSSCAVSISVDWSTSIQNHSQNLYENGIEIASIDYPLTSYSYNTTLQLNRGYNYSVATSNCNGISSHFESATISPIKSYNITNSDVSILYNQSSDSADLHWNLTQNSLQILLIEYFLQFNYTYTQDDISEYFYYRTTLHILSNITNFSMQLIHHNFSTDIGLSTNISVSLKLMKQCGQALPQRIILGTFSTTTPSVENAAFNKVLAETVLVFIGFLILVTAILLIIVISDGMYLYCKKSEGKDSKQTDGKKDKDLELNQKAGDSQLKTPNVSAPNPVYANPYN